MDVVETDDSTRPRPLRPPSLDLLRWLDSVACLGLILSVDCSPEVACLGLLLSVDWSLEVAWLGLLLSVDCSLEVACLGLLLSVDWPLDFPWWCGSVVSLVFCLSVDSSGFLLSWGWLGSSSLVAVVLVPVSFLASFSLGGSTGV